MPYKDRTVQLEYFKNYYKQHREKKISAAKVNYFDNYKERREQRRKWAEDNKEYLNKYRKVYYSVKYPYEKRKAVWTVYNAIRSGKLIRKNSCTICNSRKRIQAHHSDYSKPLEVVWLCQSCHHKEHRKE